MRRNDEIVNSLFITAFAITFSVAVVDSLLGLCSIIRSLELCRRRVQHYRRSRAPIISDTFWIAQLLFEHLLYHVNPAYEESFIFLIYVDIFLLKDMPSCVDQDL